MSSTASWAGSAWQISAVVPLDQRLLLVIGALVLSAQRAVLHKCA